MGIESILTHVGVPEVLGRSRCSGHVPVFTAMSEQPTVIRCARVCSEVGLTRPVCQPRLKVQAQSLYSHANVCGVCNIVPIVQLDRCIALHFVLDSTVIAVLHVSLSSKGHWGTHRLVITHSHHVGLGRCQRCNLIVECLVQSLIVLHDGRCVLNQ